MRMMLLVVGLGLVGCAHSPTPYQPFDGDSGGYQDFQISHGRFHIEVRGNGYTSEFALEQYFHRRADALCRDSGFASHQGDPAHEATAYSGSGHVGRYGNVSSSSRPSKFRVVGDVTCI